MDNRLSVDRSWLFEWYKQRGKQAPNQTLGLQNMPFSLVRFWRDQLTCSNSAFFEPKIHEIIQGSLFNLGISLIICREELTHDSNKKQMSDDELKNVVLNIWKNNSTQEKFVELEALMARRNVVKVWNLKLFWG